MKLFALHSLAGFWIQWIVLALAVAGLFYLDAHPGAGWSFTLAHWTVRITILVSVPLCVVRAIANALKDHEGQ